MDANRLNLLKDLKIESESEPPSTNYSGHLAHFAK